MSDVETLGVTLPVKTWAALLALCDVADRTPSDYLRVIIERNATAIFVTDPAAPSAAANTSQEAQS